jgi:hypothetical protein
VDLSEVKRLLNRRSVQALRAETVSAQKDPPKKEPAKAREKALESKDEGKFFTEASWKRVAPAAEKLLKEKGIDFLVETVTVPPKGDADKIAALKPAEREKFFREYAEGRATELKLNGVFVFASKKPATLYVHVSDPKDFPTGFATKLKTALLDSFKANKYDEGLSKVIDMTLEAKGLGEKK